MDITMTIQSNGAELRERIINEGITDVETFIQQNLQVKVLSVVEQDSAQTP